MQDLTHLLDSSKVSAQIDLNSIPLSAEATNIQSALSEGEDFELLLTINSKKYSQLRDAWAKAFPRVALTKIGEIISGRPTIHYFNNKVYQKNFRSKPGFTHF